MLNTLDLIVEQDKDYIIKDIQKLVQINSIQGAAEEGKPFGEGPAKALQHALSLCQKFGFSIVNMDNYVGYAEFGEGEEVLAILVHVDVVPVGSGWTVDPFGGEIRGNLLYGRGAYDDKGGVVASIYALKSVKDAGVLFNRRVRIILGANEETGMMDIPYYLKREAQPDMAFSPDSPFPVVYGEKGILDFKVTYKTGEMPHILYFHAGDNIKFTPELCEVSLYVSKNEKAEIIQKLQNFDRYESEYEEVEPGILNIRIKGTRVFAVRPQDGINAATGMINFLFQIDFLKNEIGNFCVFYLTKFGYSHDGSNIDCDFRDQISTPLTLSPDLFDLENNAITFSVHCRFPVTIDFETVISKIKSGIVEENVFISSERVSPAHYIPPDSKLVSSLMAVYRDFTGDSAAKPVTMEGGTYARMLKNAVAFGPLFPGEPQVAHSPNEYLNLDSIIKATKIYARSIYKLACD